MFFIIKAFWKRLITHRRFDEQIGCYTFTIKLTKIFHRTNDYCSFNSRKRILFTVTHNCCGYDEMLKAECSLKALDYSSLLFGLANDVRPLPGKAQGII